MQKMAPSTAPQNRHTCESEKKIPVSLTGARNMRPSTPGEQSGLTPANDVAIASFEETVWREGARLYRDLPWRRTTDPYHIFVSEVMLQQTQVVRVEKHWDTWMERFPVLEALAEAPLADVLASWQGMGYNRRAIALQKAAHIVARVYQGRFPESTEELMRLPGVGAATAAGLRAFAFNLPSLYLETNVRTVFLHEFFPDAVGVPDAELLPLLATTCPGYSDFAAGETITACDNTKGPRAWYYALLDYGAYLKKVLPNPSRRSKSHTKQSAYEGSRRQKRAELIRLLLAAHELNLDELTEALTIHEQKEGRPSVEAPLVQSIMEDLEQEGFCASSDGTWFIPS